MMKRQLMWKEIREMIESMNSDCHVIEDDSNHFPDDSTVKFVHDMVTNTHGKIAAARESYEMYLSDMEHELDPEKSTA